jgi:hypothetical protein
VGIVGRREGGDTIMCRESAADALSIALPILFSKQVISTQASALR